MAAVLAIRTSSIGNGLVPSYPLSDDMRTASFSAYVTDDEERAFPPPCIKAMQEPLYQTNPGSKKFAQNGELRIFEAERYFNGGIDTVDRPVPRSGSRVGTPSHCSEASWNSQHALLPSGRREYDQPALNKQGSGKRYIPGLGCNCSGKKSVDIDEQNGEIKSSSNGRRIFDLGAPLHGDMVNMMGLEPPKIGRIQAKPISFSKEDAFSFPPISPAPRKMGAQEMPRISLEVFGSPLLARSGRMDPVEHRRLLMSAMDSGHKIDEILAASGRQTVIDDGAGSDVGSDSSSDLFEIGVVPRCLSRQDSTDDRSSLADNASCYAPSEASIEWSVVTASAADFSAAGSEYGGDRAGSMVGPINGVAKANGRNKRVSMVKEAQKKNPGAKILGCRSAKAIEVVTGNVKSWEKPKEQRHRAETVKPLTLYAGATRMSADIDNSPRLLARSSASLSHTTPPFYALQTI